MRTERRLRKATDFKRLVATGRRARSDGITVFAAPRPEGDVPSRSGLSVSLPGRKAVERNRIRRRLKHAFAEIAPGAGWDVVIRADGQALGRSFQELRRDLERALQAAIQEDGR